MIEEGKGSVREKFFRKRFGGKVVGRRDENVLAISKASTKNPLFYKGTPKALPLLNPYETEGKI